MTSGVPCPFETTAPRTPSWRASRMMAAAHSAVIRGSLYVLVITGAPVLAHSSRISSGVTSWILRLASGSPPSRDREPACEVSQFWHQRHRNEHPSIPNETVGRPGRTWKKGFFSIGSHCAPATYPHGTRSFPPELNRTLQTPACPSKMGQQCPHAVHRIRRSSRRSQSTPSRVFSASRAASVGICHHDTPPRIARRDDYFP